jgi:uncharacterized ion transporter superfamily protein YfcC
MTDKTETQNMSDPMVKIGLRSLVFAASILLFLMITTGILSRFIPSGSYERIIEGGRETIINNSFSFTENVQVPVWRWFTAPIEVLWGPDSVTVISIIVFMFFVAGSISVMQAGGILAYLISAIVQKFSGKKYRMEATLILVFMLFGSILGSMEEVVVLVPLIVALSVRMGWDTETGLGLSLGAIAFGFAAAISNPFTVGVAQKIAGLPIFSGALFRMLIFVIIYTIYTIYVVRFSKRTETGMLKQGVLRKRDETAIQPDNSNMLPTWSSAKKMRASLLWFLGCMIVMILLIIISSFISALSSLILVVVMLCFLAGGIGAGYVSGMRTGLIGKSFITGIGGVAPGIILVLMAASIKHILSSAEVMDSILYWAAGRISQAGPYSAALIIYGLVLVLNFFISSGSAKAFLIVPIIAPLADIVGLSRQSAVLAYIFGDGFSNILYPTNALLLICLSITGVSYGRWFKWIWKIEAIILIFTVLMLMLAVKIGY